MTHPLVEQIADAVLYEGYLLYPYRPTSVKNRQRWTFGGLFPQDSELARSAAEPCSLQTECLVEGDAAVRVRVRFLHLIERWVGGRPWQEAEDRAVELPELRLDTPTGCHEFAFPGRNDGDGREQREVRGAVEWTMSPVAAGLVRLTVRVLNLTPPERPDAGREELLPIALVSSHVILMATGGAFVSHFDPPAEHREDGTWWKRELVGDYLQPVSLRRG